MKKGFLKKAVCFGLSVCTVLSMGSIAFAENDRKIPVLDDMYAADSKIVFDINNQTAVKEEDMVFDIKGLRISEKGEAIAPVRAAAEVLGIDPETISWDEKRNTIYAGNWNTYFTKNYFSPEPVFKYEPEAKRIVSYRNNGIDVYEAESVNIDGNIYLPLRKIMNACGIDDSRIGWNGEEKTVTADFTPSFLTNKVTICFKCGDSIQSKEDTVFNITDEAIVKEFTDLCSTGHFDSYAINESEEKFAPDMYVDFNNGTVIYFDWESQIGILLGNYMVPPEIFDYVKNYVDTASQNLMEFRNVYFVQNEIEEEKL